MRVSWDEFRETCVAISKTNAPGLPKTEEDIAGIWRALDKDCGGWIALREFDKESFDAVAQFKRWADETHGSVVQAFRQLGGRNPKLTEAELQKAGCYGGEPNPNVQLLIEGLNLNENVNVHHKTLPNGLVQKIEIPYLMEGDIRFLDKWDLSWEDQQAEEDGGYSLGSG